MGTSTWKPSDSSARMRPSFHSGSPSSVASTCTSSSSSLARQDFRALGFRGLRAQGPTIEIRDWVPRRGISKHPAGTCAVNCRSFDCLLNSSSLSPQQPISLTPLNSSTRLRLFCLKQLSFRCLEPYALHCTGPTPLNSAGFELGHEVSEWETVEVAVNQDRRSGCGAQPCSHNFTIWLLGCWAGDT